MVSFEFLFTSFFVDAFFSDAYKALIFIPVTHINTVLRIFPDIDASHFVKRITRRNTAQLLATQWLWTYNNEAAYTNW